MATAAQTHARAHVSTRCGNKYTPACVKPTIKSNPVSTKCVNPGGSYTVPSLHFTSNAGIREIQIREGAKTLKTITFKGSGPTQYTLKGLAVSTLRLDAGGHPLVVKITDVKGRSTTKSLSLAICATTPKIVNNTPPAAKCVSTGTDYKLPKVTFTSDTGLRSVEVTEGSRVLKTVSFKSGVTQYTLNGASVATLGLASGGHDVLLRAIDVKGRSASKTVRFTVCVTTPVFTG